MSEQKVYNCDCCGSELLASYDSDSYDPDRDRIKMPVGLLSGPSGGSSTIDRYSIDLCQRCLAKAVNDFLNNRSSFEYNDAIKYILNSPKKFFVLNIKEVPLV